VSRHVLGVAVLWLVLTAIGELLAVSIDFYPLPRSDKGEEIEKAFRILVYFAVPVLTMVVSVLVYMVVARRAGGEPPADGPPLQGKGVVPATWFAVTAGLTFVVMVFPGLTSLGEIVGDDSNPDLTVQVEGVQWTWLVSYPEQGIERSQSMVLPVDRTIRFEITSLDVLHSFWVPAFLMKIDAVPGKTTLVTLRPTEVGSYETDDLLRLQCAELCGLSHSRMMIPVSVVSEEDFAAWVGEKQVAAPAAPGANPAVTLAITGKDLRFDSELLDAPAGQPFAIEFKNADDGVPHNIAIYADESAQQALHRGELFPGEASRTELVPALAPGTYTFRCDAHPTTMTGELVAK
jgi:cytochrome c oxidase subunit 2